MWTMGSEEFRIDDERKELMDIFLEMLHVVRKDTDEGFVQEPEVEE